MPTPYDPSEHHSRDPLYEEPVFNPSVLSHDATKATDTDILKALGAMPKRRGRPPGSKNKPKMDAETGQLSGGPRVRQTATPSVDAKVDIERRIREKKKRTDELEAKIINDGNAALMQLFVTMGVPPTLLYVNPPKAKTITPNFTPLAQQIAIQPTTAKILAMTMAEWEGSSMGAKVATTMLQDSPLRLAVLTIGSVLMIGQQVKTVMSVQKQFEPFLKAYKKAQAEREEAAANGKP